MRVAWTYLLVAALLAPLAVSSAFAEDEAPKPAAEEPKPAEPKPEPKPEPDPEVPAYSIEFLMPGEDDVPEGWKMRDSGAPQGSPTEGVLEEMSEACKCSLNEDNFYVETTVMKSGEHKVAVAMVDVDASVWAFRRKLDEAAAAGGWSVTELGAKGRLLIVGAGAKQAEVAEAMKSHVIYRFCRMAMDRLGGFGGTQEQGRNAAIAYSKAIQNVAPDSGAAYAVVGTVHWLKSRPKHKQKPTDPALMPEVNKCREAWTKALDPKAKYPPKGSILVFCSGELGQILLLQKKDTNLELATRVLEISVKEEQEGRNNNRRFGNRYNLACAYARGGKTDKAFDMLKKALQTGKSLPPGVFRPQYIHMKDKDPDMASLRQDSRWNPLMTEFKPPEPKNRRGKKKKQDTEEKKDGH